MVIIECILKVIFTDFNVNNTSTENDNCLYHPDFYLTDVSSRLHMENKGWTLDTDNQFDKWSNELARSCGDKTWYGFRHPGVGKISATFVGTGAATLDYGNCFKAGEVNVYLNGKLIDTTLPNTPSKQKTLNFVPEDVLSLDENPDAIINLNSLKLHCEGK